MGFRDRSGNGDEDGGRGKRADSENWAISGAEHASAPTRGGEKSLEHPHRRPASRDLRETVSGHSGGGVELYVPSGLSSLGWKG